MIPHIIHYCWFGEKELPEEYRKYIQGWKDAFPDWEVICWNESNFPLEDVAFAKAAYEAKKWAFVSDVARIYALQQYGGIYFDTDVEVIKNFSDLLENKKCVLGTESEIAIGTGFLACEKNHPICNLMMNYYKNTEFDPNALEPNTHILAKILQKGYSVKPSKNIVETNDFILYPQEYFTAFNGALGKTEIDEKTMCIHHLSASWIEEDSSIKAKIIGVLRKTKKYTVYYIKKYVMNLK